MTDAYDEVMNRLNNTRPVTHGQGRDPYIAEGNHDSLIIVSVETFKNQDQQLCVRASFEVERSQTMAPGTRCCCLWNLFRNAPKPGMASDSDRFVEFVCVLQGIQLGSQHASVRSLLKTRAEGGNLEAQPARGARIAARGYNRASKTTGKVFTNVEWKNVPQDGNMIAQTRAMLDAKAPYVAPAPQTPPMQPQQVQYAAQPQQWIQPQPSTVQPQYAQPQPAPQQYVQQPAPSQTVGVPMGGFLAMLPPNK